MHSSSSKIINDPVYGFIKIPRNILFDVLEHPFMQRLRRIKQLGLTHLVYPGALHTRFHHALGALHLMQGALDTLRNKGVGISDEEYTATCLAILLHDAGHGPFSHALESVWMKENSHENISLQLMKKMNEEQRGKLDTAIDIFTGTHQKKFLHQLVSSQLDVDRLDYLNRDSFYTGVHEGVIGSDRIIMMLDVAGNELVVEEKGIYSIEKFLLARRFMYWQVYLHKTVLAAEFLLIKILQRAKELSAMGQELFGTSALKYFFSGTTNNHEMIDNFTMLDDSDISVSTKEWMNHPDEILSLLCKALMNRHLPKVEFRNKAVSVQELENIFEKQRRNISKEHLHYFAFCDVVKNSTYSTEKIKILTKSGKVIDFSEVATHFNTLELSDAVSKHFLWALNFKGNH